jgi:hypothetical protein
VHDHVACHRGQVRWVRRKDERTGGSGH